ncbi:gamma-glutamyltransferase family protein [Microlunatus sp. Y2014]|uniref:gamma-glutamyltransferase family protein n=1 Tax=Microlunatus sp. Y2014 TaxID=3418488 RepID=UPI003DA79AF1
MTANESSRSRRVVAKTPATGKQGMVVAHNLQAAEVGAALLRDGASAFDAAIAMSFTTAVREVAMNGIGGVGVLLAHSAETGETSEINFYGRTPQGLAEDTFVPHLLPADTKTSMGFRGVAGGRSERGPLSVGVPTYVAGLAELHRQYGTRPWAELLQPAIDLAEQGFEPDEEDVVQFATRLHLLQEDAEFVRVHLTDGLPRPTGFYEGSGVPIRQPDLAATLTELAAGGPEVVHGGRIGQVIGDHIQALGGVLSSDDLARYEAETTLGLRGSYHGYEIVTSSGMNGGLTLLQLLNLTEQLDLGKLARDEGEFWHLVAEVMRQAWTDRFCYAGDPAGAEVPAAGLVSKEYAASVLPNLSGGVVRDRTTPGDPWAYDTIERVDRAPAGDPGGNDTTHLVAADADGNVVTLTQTLGLAFGSGVVVPTTGILLHDITMWLNPEPGTPNSVGPWKKQLGHATPVLVLKDGRPVAALGAPGGRRVVTSVFQTIVNMIDFGMDVQTAVGEPRLHLEGADPSAPDGPTIRTLTVDDRLPDSIIADLVRRGHDVVPVRETGGISHLGKPLGIQFTDDGLVGGVDVFRKSIGIGV